MELKIWIKRRIMNKTTILKEDFLQQDFFLVKASIQGDLK